MVSEGSAQPRERVWMSQPLTVSDKSARVWTMFGSKACVTFPKSEQKANRGLKK